MARDLARLLAPKSVAVIGGGYWCAATIEQLQKIGFAGRILAVHPTRAEIAGIATFPSIDALPCPPDASFVGINRHATVDALRALVRIGAGGAVCFASGFREASGEDEAAAQLQADLIKAAGDMPILGPNCYGFVNTLDRAVLWPDQHGLVPVDKGVAILTQSSNIAINMSMQRRALPIACIVTVGNQAQTDMAEIAAHLLADDRITALGLHIEGINDLSTFEDMARAAQKPIIALKVGRSIQAQTAAVSHTASLAGSAAGSDALMARLGIGQAQNIPAFIDALHILHLCGPLPSTQIASLSCSGGEASMMADAGLNHPVTFPALNERQINDLRGALGPMVALANPLDYHTYVWGDVPKMTAAFVAMADPKLAMTVLVLDLPRADICEPQPWDCAIKAVIAARAQSGHRLGVVTSLPENLPEDAAARLAQNGVVPLFDFDAGLAAIAAAAACQPAADALPVLKVSAPQTTAVLSEFQAKNLLRQAGLYVGANAMAQTGSDLETFTRAHSGPFVLKTTDEAHKSDTGGVQLHLSAQATGAVAAKMGFPLLIEQMIQDGIVELLVSVIRDPAHGFVLTLGAGGIYTEILKDTAHLLIPTTRGDIDDALSKLRIAPILRGYRGKAAIDRAALLDNIEALQAFVINNGSALEEVEINPMICTPTSAVVADALIRMDPDI